MCAPDGAGVSWNLRENSFSSLTGAIAARLTPPLAKETLFVQLRAALPTSFARKLLTPLPEILIFDVDGVLVDVRQSFWRSALETVHFLTGKRVTWPELYSWKNRPGNNDDWTMVSRWATALGKPTSYEQARDAFQQFYWDTDGRPGNVRRERILITAKQLKQWSKCFELNLFTGRTGREFSFTFHKWPGTPYFRTVITMDDVPRKKPHPDGLLKILGDRPPLSALYVGDNVDDALAARAAGVRFLAILPPGIYGCRQRAAQFRKLGALGLIPRITAINPWLGRSPA